MKIAIDGMGGDYSPHAVVQGCIEAVKEYKNIEIIITGSEALISRELSKYEGYYDNISILDAKETISNNEHPVMALRRKKDSSIYRALELVKKGEADAVISAGSTGAFLAGATLVIGRIKGVNRPALAPVMPGKNGPFMVVDCGANAECKPNNLVQFAQMGEIYFKNILNVKRPTVGLINIGSEEEKGNELTKEAHKLLKECDFNFIGNVEPREIPVGDVNVLVCDGFVGNTVLKMYEGVAQTIFSTLKEEIISSFRTKLGGALLKPVFTKFKKDFDYKEYGGAAFLGVNGICIKAHGSSDHKAIKNAIRQSINFYENDIIGKIKVHIEEKMV